MADPIRIDVTTASRPYTVWVGSGILRQLSTLLDEAGVGARRFAVSSPPVWKHWGTAVRESLPAIEPVPVPDGERDKTLSQVAEIYDALCRAGADRSSAILSVGGGVISDMAGFAAATYMRGISLAHVPTTLLAQVDAAIGGKVGVNLPGGKNLVGSFYQPWVVVSDPQVLSTLPRREFRAGLYEVIKYGVACSRSLFDAVVRHLSALSRRNPDTLTPIIADCCRIKAEVVGRDERDNGPREVLNCGHTTGHAMEAVTRYQRFLHGEAVAYGLMVAADVSVARGLLSPAGRDEVNAVIAKLGPLPSVSDLYSRALIEQMRRDKKARDNRVRFVLPTDIGAAMTVDDVSDEELTTALRNSGVAS
jgi:3-dehydroquinate synthase